MKRRVLPIAMIICMILALVPSAPSALAAGEFEAQLLGELDEAVNPDVGAWSLEEFPENKVEFNLREEATIAIEFSNPVKFTGNWTGIATNVPVSGNDEATALGGGIVSFVVDGEDLGSRYVPLIDRDDEGFLTIDIARQWGGDYDAYGLQEMEPFSKIEITFIIGVFQAQLLGELDESVNPDVGAWSLEGFEENLVRYALGEEATIALEFSNPVKFTGNWTGIATNVPVSGNASAEGTGAQILSFVVDGEDLGSREVPLIDRDDSGLLTIDIARQWGGDYDPYGLQDMEPFTSIEITFVVASVGSAGEEEETEEVDIDYDKVYQACIGGTFLSDTDESGFDWILFEDRTVDFKINETFTAVLDYGSDKQTHGEASWGYITVVQTNITDIPPAALNAYIESIKVDGNDVRFDDSVIEVGYGDNADIRISLTNGWAQTPVVESPMSIGEFSKLEVTMAFTDLEFVPEFGTAADDAEPEAPAEAPPPVILDPNPEPEPEQSGGLPVWALILIIVGAVAVVAVVIVLIVKGKKKAE